MNVGQLRAALEGVPDDVEIEACDPGDPSVGIREAQYIVISATPFRGYEDCDSFVLLRLGV